MIASCQLFRKHFIPFIWRLIDIACCTIIFLYVSYFGSLLCFLCLRTMFFLGVCSCWFGNNFFWEFLTIYTTWTVSFCSEIKFSFQIKLSKAHVSPHCHQNWIFRVSCPRDRGVVIKISVLHQPPTITAMSTYLQNVTFSQAMKEHLILLCVGKIQSHSWGYFHFLQGWRGMYVGKWITALVKFSPDFCHCLHSKMTNDNLPNCVFFFLSRSLLLLSQATDIYP